jgi:nitroreductase
MSQLPDPLAFRQADHDIETLFLRRWSPRAMTGEPISGEELNQLFEAARWAPSTYNEQEWRFLYATRDGQHWAAFFGLLTEANQEWCHKAGALIVVLSHRFFSRNGKPNPVHTFDAGLATQNLLLQGTALKLVCHAMAGFDRGKARRELLVPDDYDVEAMIAVGRAGDPDDLPEKMRELDRTPSGRHPIRAFAAEGLFAFA